LKDIKPGQHRKLNLNFIKNLKTVLEVVYANGPKVTWLVTNPKPFS
jgi:hypothetical protein